MMPWQCKVQCIGLLCPPANSQLVRSCAQPRTRTPSTNERLLSCKCAIPQTQNHQWSCNSG